MKTVTYKITFYETKADFKKKKATESLEGYETKANALSDAKIFFASEENEVIVVSAIDKSFTKVFENA